MIPVQVEYAAPTGLDEVVALLQRGANAKVLAGGHTLLTEMKRREAAPSALVDLRNVQVLRHIDHRDGGLQIGAMTTLTEVALDPVVKDRYHALMEAIRGSGDPQDRNVGTIGGSLASLASSTGIPAVAIALDAVVNLVGPYGARAVSMADLHRLEPAEVLASVTFPPQMAGTGGAYEKLENPADGSAICGVAVQVTLRPDGVVESCRVAVAGATERATRLREVEAVLESKQATKEHLAAAASRAAEGVSFIADLWASAEYRAHLARVLAGRALERAVGRAN